MSAYLLLVVKALVVILENETALLLAGIVSGRGVDNIASHNLLPEGKAAADAWSPSWCRQLLSDGIRAAIADLLPFMPYPDAILSQLGMCRGFARVGRGVVVELRFVGR